jgi:hypothetical protein
LKNKNKVLPVAVLLILSLAASLSHSLVFGGSNLSLSSYPSANCYKPSPPYEPYSLDSQWEVDNYNSEVDRYNMNMRIYTNCINTYVENAQNDIKRIKEAISDAIN